MYAIKYPDGSKIMQELTRMLYDKFGKEMMITNKEIGVTQDKITNSNNPDRIYLR